MMNIISPFFFLSGFYWRGMAGHGGAWWGRAGQGKVSAGWVGWDGVVWKMVSYVEGVSEGLLMDGWMDCLLSFLFWLSSVCVNVRDQLEWLGLVNIRFESWRSVLTV